MSLSEIDRSLLICQVYVREVTEQKRLRSLLLRAGLARKDITSKIDVERFVALIYVQLGAQINDDEESVVFDFPYYLQSERTLFWYQAGLKINEETNRLEFWTNNSSLDSIRPESRWKCTIENLTKIEFLNIDDIGPHCLLTGTDNAGQDQVVFLPILYSLTS